MAIDKTIVDKIAGDPFARHMGARLISVEEGRAEAELEFRPELANFAGLMHGGAVFALADFVFSAAANSRGTLEVAVNVSINFLASPAAGEKITGVATEVSGSRKLGHYRIEITDSTGKACALMHGVTYRKGSNF